MQNKKKTQYLRYVKQRNRERKKIRARFKLIINDRSNNKKREIKMRREEKETIVTGCKLKKKKNKREKKKKTFYPYKRNIKRTPYDIFLYLFISLFIPFSFYF